MHTTDAAVLWALCPYGIVVGLPAGSLVVLAGLKVTRVLGPAERAILARVPLVGRYARLLS